MLLHKELLRRLKEDSSSCEVNKNSNEIKFELPFVAKDIHEAIVHKLTYKCWSMPTTGRIIYRPQSSREFEKALEVLNASKESDHYRLINSNPCSEIKLPDNYYHCAEVTAGDLVMFKEDNIKKEVYNEGVENLVRITVDGERYLIDPSNAKSDVVIRITERCAKRLTNLQVQIDAYNTAAESAGLITGPSNVAAHLRQSMEVYRNIFNTISTFNIVD